MNTLVVDTDIVSYLFKNDSRAELYKPDLEGHLLIISFMTLAELERWALERDWGEYRKRKMQDHLHNFIIHPYNKVLCLKWAEASISAQRKGKPIKCADAWIAATALLYNISLITNNGKDYEGVDGLKLISKENP